MPERLESLRSANTTFIYALSDPRTREIRYIGKSDEPEKRLRQHIKDSHHERNRKANWIKSLLKKGLRPLVETIDEVLKSEWQPVEAAYILFYKNEGCTLANATPGGDGFGAGEDHPLFGTKLSPERCEAMSAALKGEKCCWFGKQFSADHRAKISEARKGEKNPNFGKKLSPEHRAILIAAHKGKKLSPEQRAKISATSKKRIGKKHTPEERAKISAGNKGKKRSPEMRARLSAMNKGKQHTAESRAKMRKAHRERLELKRNERTGQLQFTFDALRDTQVSVE